MSRSRPRVAFIVPRYGEGITGEAESQCRRTAERLARYFEVEVLTTCATDRLSWRNVLPDGSRELNGVLVRRFRLTEERDAVAFQRLYDRILRMQLTPEEEYEVVRTQGPYAPALVDYVRERARDYDAFVVFSYLSYTAIHTLPILKSKAIFVPAARDEKSLYLNILDEVFRQTPRILFSTEEEQFLLQRRFNLPGGVGRIVGLGMDEPSPGEPDNAWEKLRSELENKRVLTCPGRVEDGEGEGGEGSDELAGFFVRFVEEQKRTDVILLLLGKRTLPLPPHRQIVSAGYVSGHVKYRALQETDIGVAPFIEGLCMDALETWMHGRPMLVNGRSPVLVGHCLRSNGGLWYTSYGEFREALGVLLDNRDMLVSLGRQGRAYVRSGYRWDTVEKAYRDAIQDVILGAERPAPNP
jgi:glycosyltransferase involved in cell wall biosynthesis